MSDDRLKRCLGDIARLIIGEPNRTLSTREQMRFGHQGSLAVNIAGPTIGTWYSHENEHGGGVLDFLEVHAELKGEAAWAWLREHGFIDDDPMGIKREPAKIVATYDYVDRAGELLFQVVRFQPKDFRQRRPDGNGGWIWNLRDVERVPYHFDEIGALAGTGARVFILEGEKDCDRLRQDWHVFTTTCPGGAGKWLPGYSAFFAGLDVVVIPDNDQAGHEHAHKTAAALAAHAASVKVLHLAGLPPKGDVSDWLDAGGTQAVLEDLVDGLEPFDAAPEPVSESGTDAQPEVISAGRDLGVIPPRQWLLGTNFCRGYLSGLTGAGGTGKTAVRLLQLIALALGRGDLTGDHCFKRTKVLVVCLEDDDAELRRRIRAACVHHGIQETELDGWLYYWTPHDLRFLSLGKFNIVEEGGLAAALEGIIRRLQIGVVSIDPFVKSHGANENDNMQIDRAATAFLAIAHDCGCACDYVHHDRKGVSIAGDADRARGASALVNASRLIKTLSPMSRKEAEELGIEEDDDWRRLVRLDDAKINIAPASDKAVWFRLVGVSIGNSDPDYPHGDNVQAVEIWQPPELFGDVTKTMLAEIFDQLRTGPHPEEGYLADVRANEAWAGWPICKIANKAKGEAKRILRTWIKNGVLIEDEYMSKARKRLVTRVLVNDLKAAEIVGSLYGQNGLRE